MMFSFKLLTCLFYVKFETLCTFNGTLSGHTSSLCSDFFDYIEGGSLKVFKFQ